jgi:hypothetical protein
LKDAIHACFYSAAVFIVVIYFDIYYIVNGVNVSVVDIDDNVNIGVD